MTAHLTFRFTDRPARRFSLDDGAAYVVGRGAECDLRIDDSRVSRRHARIESRSEPGDEPGGGASWLLSDLGSKNGLRLDGRPVTTPVALPKACWLSLGGLLARFERVSDEERRSREERDLTRWQTTLQLQRRLEPAADLPGLLARLLRSVLELSGAERGFVLLARADGDLEVAATAGVAAGELGREEFSGSVGAVERALAQRRPVVTCDAQDDATLASRPSIAGEGIRALVCLPLEVLGQLIGAVYADSRTPGSAFTELDVEILQALTSHAALAIAVARLSREVEGLAGELPTAIPVYDPAAAAPDPTEATWSRLVAVHAPGRNR
ncbi:MAG TPA: GAF domain-containing protein [Thermoanaerobaculia bacterium]|nr:GAF domain-containing protein [Thermoanaerobaculia bacterium]